MSVEEILAELVAIDSTSTRTNVRVVTHLAARAGALGRGRLSRVVTNC